MALAVAFAAACASTPSGPGNSREGVSAAPSASAPQAGPPGAGGILEAPSLAGLTSYIRRVAAFNKWGLPVATARPPAPPAVKPPITTQVSAYEDQDLVPVVFRVPTEERVVFLTIDDGAEKDAAFADLLRDLKVPVSSFLTHEEARDDYGYFRGLQRLGNAMHNHTVRHRNMPRLSYRAQRREICAQQANLEREFGVRPRLFRPPYGNYDRDTLRAAGECGVDVVVMWSLEAWAKRIDWQEADRRLRPGDIVLTHFRGRAEWGGTMNDMARRMLRSIADQGFAVARLEDYL